jgi:hypothetical protein
VSHHSNSHQPSDRCSFCYGLIIFDHSLDLNTCIRCGAQETTRGWQLGTLPSEESGSGGKHLLDKLRLAAQTLDPELQVPRLGFSNH